MPVEVIFDPERQPKIRIDRLTGASVIVSDSRRLKERKEILIPGAYCSLPEWKENCPFCPSHEGNTPKELVRISVEGKWQCRGFANRYPALTIEERENAREESEFYKDDEQEGVGAHEIIVESPKHNFCLSRASKSEIAAVFEAIKYRYFDLKNDSRLRYFYCFKNYGPGASQDHPHWQVEARIFAPHIIYEKCKNMSEYKLKHGKCYLCQLWRVEEKAWKEKKAGRMVLETEHFFASVPFAPSEPYQVIIMPKEHSPCFASYLEGEISFELAEILKDVMVKVKKVLQGENWQKDSDIPYLFCFYTAPYTEDAIDGYYHWHFEVLPRTTQKVGHERGTGEDIIPIFPEDAAAILRAA